MKGFSNAQETYILHFACVVPINNAQHMMAAVDHFSKLKLDAEFLGGLTNSKAEPQIPEELAVHGPELTSPFQNRR